MGVSGEGFIVVARLHTGPTSPSGEKPWPNTSNQGRRSWHAATERRVRRKQSDSLHRPETEHKCSLCNRDCHSRIGLHSHRHRCAKQTTRMLPMVNPDRWRPTTTFTEMWSILVPGNWWMTDWLYWLTHTLNAPTHTFWHGDGHTPGNGIDLPRKLHN